MNSNPAGGKSRTGSDGVTITCTVTRAGLTLWRDPDGQLHNPDGPALSSVDGEQMWCRHGKPHRDGDLPAHIDRYGVARYYRDGKLHRDGDLPAVDGPEKGPWRTRQFYIDGVRHRDGGQSAVEGGGGTEYFEHGVRHRDGGPAVERSDGQVEFWVAGRRHRGDGPAVVKPGVGGEEFWLNGVRYADVWAYKEAGGSYEVPVVRAPAEPEPASKTIRRRKAA